MMIITGTPAGTAWSVDHEIGGCWQPKQGVVAAIRYCLPGDLIESEIQSIGVLRNTVIQALAIAIRHFRRRYMNNGKLAVRRALRPVTLSPHKSGYSDLEAPK